MSLTITTSSPFLATDGSAGIVHAPTEYTIAQAARILEMSEGCVNELLDEGAITFRLKNGERLVQRDRLLEFDSEYRKRCEGLARIAQWSQEMGLYD